MKKTLMLLLLPCSLFAGEFDLHLAKEMQYIRTPEDRKLCGFFSALYDMAAKREKPAGSIPKTLHVIWLGPQGFPEESVKNVKSWIDHHSGWKIKFWTDLGHKAPDDRMEVSSFEMFPLEELKEIYYRCDNYGERSEILRYAVLLNEGGIYVDHDARCVKPFDSLQENHDFFCGLEPLGPTVLSSSVNPSPHLLASSAQHPILKETKRWLMSEWNRLEEQYPGADPSSIHNRVQHRGFRALGVGIRAGHNRAGRKDIVFPPDYFSMADPGQGIFAVHGHEGLWHREEKSPSIGLVQGIRKTWILGMALGAVNVGACAFWMFPHAKKKKGEKEMTKTLALFLLLTISSFARDAEDIQTLAANLYEKNQLGQYIQEGKYKIPPVIHFIWLGPRPFPPESVENVRCWIQNHPGWTVKFWTDRERECPCEGMEKMVILELSFLKLGKQIEQAQNWEEKSDLLRYEILSREGGIYVDHGTQCVKQLHGMNRGYDFFCGLDHELTCSKALIGSRPRHPTLEKTVQLISERWDPLGEKFRGNDEHSKIELVLQRTSIALTDALAGTIDRDENTDMIFPAGYFKQTDKPQEDSILGKIRSQNKDLALLLIGLIVFNGAAIGYRHWRKK